MRHGLAIRQIATGTTYVVWLVAFTEFGGLRFCLHPESDLILSFSQPRPLGIPAIVGATFSFDHFGNPLLTRLDLAVPIAVPEPSDGTPCPPQHTAAIRRPLHFLNAIF